MQPSLFGLRHRWTYFLRTLTDIAELLGPLERAIEEILIPAVTGHTLGTLRSNDATATRTTIKK